jgi:undecaprenyl diphosphate synthase
MNESIRSVGIIMDGNRRWAKEKGIPALEGHRAGLEKIKEVVRWAHAAGIRELIIYAFSTENWNRSEEEVRTLMNLFEFAFGPWMNEIVKEGIQIRFIGDRTRFTQKLQTQMSSLEERTRDASNGVLAIALSYGGRAEIVAATNRLISDGAREVTEASLRDAMWSTGLADPDLIIRTGGEQRLSNFLLWQSAYSELFFSDTLWPDLTKDEFDSMLEEFGARERRHGK